jgi:glyoxylase-like metal-dependent hydrolase (beta-lactamase superfamily II)
MTPTSPQLTRRAFLVDMGRGAFAIALVSLAGCAVGGIRRDPSAVPAEAAWHRLSLHDDFVSAYILVRSGEAAIVDVGGPDPAGSSTGDILAALEAMGLGWGNVGHVILTHHHLDHAGSAAEVLAAAPDAQGYAGAEDIPHFVAQGAEDNQHIVVPRPLFPVVDGDSVFDLRIVATPGHTPGHIAVLDEALGVLVVGDALTTTDGRPTSYPIGSTEDIADAQRSVAKLAALDFETLFVGHGEPIQSGAAGLVREFLKVCPLDHDLELPAGALCRFEWPGMDEGSAG